jgi:hypothetical protein
MALLRFREKPLLLRRAMLIVPLFILGHLIIAKTDETCPFLTLIIIPSVLLYLWTTLDTERQKGKLLNGCILQSHWKQKRHLAARGFA